MALTPIGATAGGLCQIGAYWYPWYEASGSHWEDGYKDTPLLGEYDSAIEVATHIQWAKRYGIDFFVASWWGWHEEALRALFNAAEREEFKIAFIYESVGRFGFQGTDFDMDDADRRERFIEDIIYLADLWLTRDTYLHIDHKPVLFIYLSRNWRGNVTSLIREAEQAAGVDLYLVGDEVYWQNPRRLGLFDAVTAYNMHSSDEEDMADFEAGINRQYTKWGAAAQRADIGFFPSVLAGFDDSVVRPEENNPIIPKTTRSLRRQLVTAKVTATNPCYILVTSWNEWHEGTTIEPAEEYEFEYLEAMEETMRVKDFYLPIVLN